MQGVRECFRLRLKAESKNDCNLAGNRNDSDLTK